MRVLVVLLALALLGLGCSGSFAEPDVDIEGTVEASVEATSRPTSLK